MSTYIQNLKDSFKYLAVDMMEDYVPQVKPITEGITKVAALFRKNNSGNVRSAVRNAVNTLPFYKESMGLMKGVYKNLSTGSIYAKGGFSMSDDSFNFDMTPIDSSQSMIIPEGETNSSSAIINENKEEPFSNDSKLITKSVVDTSRAQTKVMSNLMTRHHADQMFFLSGLKKGTEDRMDNMTSYLKSISEFNNTAMRTYIDNSLKYYNDSMAVLNDIKKGLHGGINRGSANEERELSLRERINKNGLMASGGDIFTRVLNSATYGMGSMIPAMIGMTLQMLTPMFLVKSLAEGALQKSMKLNGLKSFLNKFQIGDAFDTTMKGLVFNKNSKVSTVAESLTSKSSLSKGINLRDFKNENAGFSTQSDRTLNIVIPGYLAKILNAIQKKESGDEQYYDYTINEWTTKKAIINRVQEGIKDNTFLGAKDSVKAALMAGMGSQFPIKDSKIFDAFCSLLTKAMVEYGMELKDLPAITMDRDSRVNFASFLGLDSSHPLYEHIVNRNVYVAFINAITEGKNKSPENRALFAKVNKELQNANRKANDFYKALNADKYLNGNIFAYTDKDIDNTSNPDDVEMAKIREMKPTSRGPMITYKGHNGDIKRAADVYGKQGLAGMFQNYAAGVISENEFFKQFEKTAWASKIIGADNYKFDVASKGGVGKLFGELQKKTINNMLNMYESVTGKPVNTSTFNKIQNIFIDKTKGSEAELRKIADDPDLSEKEKKEKSEKVIKETMADVANGFKGILGKEGKEAVSQTGDSATNATATGNTPSDPVKKNGMGEKIGKYALAGFGGILGMKAVGGLVKAVPILGPFLGHFGLLSPVFLSAVGLGAGIFAAKKGIIGKIIGDDKEENKSTTGSFKNRFMNGIAAAIGMVGFGSLVSKIPKLDGLGGIIQSPLLLASTALAAGIFGERDKIKKKLFGEDSEKNTFFGNIGVALFGDKDDVRKKDGILTNTIMKFRDKMDKTSEKIQIWFRDSISENIRSALSPLGKIFLSIGGFIKSGLKKLFGFKDSPKEEKVLSPEEQAKKDKEDLENARKDLYKQNQRDRERERENGGKKKVELTEEEKKYYSDRNKKNKGLLGQGGKSVFGLFGRGGDFYYSQDNSIWGNMKVADSSVSQSGCAIACAAMALASLKNDKDITPKSLVRLADEHKVAKDGINPEFFKSLEPGFGVAVHTYNAKDVDENSVISVLKKGGRVVVMVDVNYNGVARHYIYVKGYKGNMVYISDPKGGDKIEMHVKELHSYALTYTTFFNDKSKKGKDISSDTKPKGRNKIKQWLGWETAIDEDDSSNGKSASAVGGGSSGSGGKMSIDISKGSAKQTKVLFMINHSIKSGLNGVAYNLEYIKRLLIKQGGKLDANDDPKDGAFGFAYKLKSFKGWIGRGFEGLGRGIGGMLTGAKNMLVGGGKFFGKKIGAPILEGAGKGIGGLLNFIGKVAVYPLEWINKTFDAFHKRLGIFMDTMGEAAKKLITDLYAGAKWLLKTGASAAISVGGAVGGLLLRGGVGAADAIGKSKIFESLLGAGSGVFKMLRLDKLLSPIWGATKLLGGGLKGLSGSLFGPKKVFVEGGRLDSIGHINTITAVGAVDMDAYKAVRAANKDGEKAADKAKDIERTGGKNIDKIDNVQVNESQIKELRETDKEQDNINKGLAGLAGLFGMFGKKGDTKTVAATEKKGGFNLFDLFNPKKGGITTVLGPLALGALGLAKNAGILGRGIFGGIAGVGGFAADALANVVSMIPGLRDTGIGKFLINNGRAGGDASRNFVKGADDMIADFTGNRRLDDDRVKAHRDRMAYLYLNKGLQQTAKKGLGKILTKGPMETMLLKGMYANEEAIAKKALKKGAAEAAEVGVEKSAGKLTKEGLKKLLTKDGIKTALSGLFKHPAVEKVFAKAGVEVGEKAVEKLAEKAAANAGSKIATILARGFASMVPMAGVIVQAGFFALDLAFGMSKAGEIFGIMEEDVTLKHRVVAGLVHALQGLISSASLFLFVVALIPEDFIVDWAWKSISTDEEIQLLETQRGKKIENDKKVAELKKKSESKQTVLEKLFGDSKRADAAYVANNMDNTRFKYRDDILDKNSINRSKEDLAKIRDERTKFVDNLVGNKYSDTSSKAAKAYRKSIEKFSNDRDYSGWFGGLKMHGQDVPRSVFGGNINIDKIVENTKLARELGDTAYDNAYRNTIIYNQNMKIGQYSYKAVGCGPFALRAVYASMGDKRFNFNDAVKVADFYSTVGAWAGKTDKGGVPEEMLVNYMVYDGYTVYKTSPGEIMAKSKDPAAVIAKVLQGGGKVILLQHPNDPDLMHYTAILNVARGTDGGYGFNLYDNLFAADGGSRYIDIDHPTIKDSRYIFVTKKGNFDGFGARFGLKSDVEKIINLNPNFDYSELGTFDGDPNLFFEAKAYALYFKGDGINVKPAMENYSIFDRITDETIRKYAPGANVDKDILRKRLIKDYFNDTSSSGNGLAVGYDNKKNPEFVFQDTTSMARAGITRVYKNNKWMNMTSSGYEYVGKAGSGLSGRFNSNTYTMNSANKDKNELQNVKMEFVGRGLKIKPTGNYINNSMTDNLTEMNNRLTEIAVRQSAANTVGSMGVQIDNSKSEAMLSSIDSKLQTMIELLSKSIQVTAATAASAVKTEQTTPQINEHFMGMLKNIVRG